MQPAIPVGSSHRAWWFLALVALTACLVIGGTTMCVARAEHGPLVLIAGGVAGLATCLAAIAIAMRKAAVEVVSDGFIVHDRSGERRIADEQVICAALYSTQNYTNGELKSTTRTFDLWIEGEGDAERLKMVNRIPLGSRDPLELLIERVLDHLHSRAEAALADREPFEGERWTLYPTELVDSRMRSPATVQLEELSAIDVFDDNLCVWKRDQDEPAIRIPIRSANTHVLLRLLRDRAPTTTAEDAHPGGDRLGRVLFERKPSQALILALWLLPLLGCGFPAGFAVAAFAQQRWELMVIGGLIGLGLGLSWLIPLTHCVRLRCHEHGIARLWLRRERRLKYADVESFTYSAVRQYVKGVYSGTTYTLTFVSSGKGKPGKLTYSKTLRNADDELDHLRDHVSRVIAARMADALASRRTVPWTEGLRFLPEGLEYRASGLLGRKAAVMLFYDQITGVDVSDGVFRMWVAGQNKPVVKESVSQANFFPGYVCLARLMASRRTEFVPAG